MYVQAEYLVYFALENEEIFSSHFYQILSKIIEGKTKVGKDDLCRQSFRGYSKILLNVAIGSSADVMIK